MAQFMYKARDGHGELMTGIIQAATSIEAGERLRADGKFIVRLDEVNDADLAVDTAQQNGQATGKIKRDLVITFAHQLSVMVETGVPISEALECVAEQSDSEAFRAVLGDVADQVQAGGELSAALRSYPKVFPSVMTSLVRASEVSGTMGRMLERVSRYLAAEQATVRKIRSALTYPMVMLIMILGVTVGLLVFVLPRFATVYQSKGQSLPWPTQLLMGLSSLMMDYWLFLLVGLGMLGALLFIVINTPTGRRFLDLLKIKSPVLGPLFAKLYMTRAARTMGTMIDAGVPILDMIAIVRNVTNNAFYEDLWDEADERLRQGAQLSDALFASPLIPRSVAQMVFAGEKSGRLGPTMQKIADFSEQEFDEQVKQTTQFIEPALVTVMGCVIGFIAIALLLPIFSVGRVVSG